MSLDHVPVHPYVQAIAASLRDNPGTQTSSEGIGIWAAVAVILRTRDQSVEVLFIRRVERDTDTWSGQVALPGGRQDPDDDTLHATAIRETWEEIGLDLVVNGRSLGALSDVAPRTPVLPPIAVRPYVFITPEPTGTSAGAEVAEIFWVPLDHLRDASRWTEDDVTAHGLTLRVPAIRYGEHVIWGMTHRIARQLVDRLTAV